MADRVVIDSAAFDHPEDDLLRLAQLLRERSKSMRVSDLNWGRLTSWRTLIASFWDVPDYRPHLERIDHVEINYDPPDVARQEIAPKALLVIGWLASRLGWRVETARALSVEQQETDARFTLRAGERAITVLLRATQDKDESDGMMASLKFSVKNDGSEFHVALSPDGTKLQTEAMIGGHRAVGRVLSYEARTEGKRLGRELAFLTRDMIYEEAVAASAAFIEALQRKS
jgi:glucose-6-phosphate dehydrogenase assembly protein OpcA